MNRYFSTVIVTSMLVRRSLSGSAVCRICVFRPSWNIEVILDWIPLDGADASAKSGWYSTLMAARTDPPSNAWTPRTSTLSDTPGLELFRTEPPPPPSLTVSETVLLDGLGIPVSVITMSKRTLRGGFG